MPSAAQPALRAAVLAAQPRALAVYGLGVVAQQVLGELADQPIAGLLDKDPGNHGRVFYGQTVLDEAALLARNVDLIVIAASDIYWPTIAARIRPFCQAHGIGILYLDGRLDADVSAAPAPIDYCPPDLGELEKRIAQADIVSFDLFETLVIRGATRPDDLLEWALLRLALPAEQAHALLAARRAAETQCTERYGRFAFELAEVYRTMSAGFAIPPASAQAMYEAELAVEHLACAARTEMVDLLARCLAQGKTTCILTDTHLPRATIQAILERCAIPPVDLLALSGESATSKHAGTLFAALRARYPGRRILHIGDNARSDVAQAEAQGLQAWRIPSPTETLAASRLSPLLAAARTTEDHLLLGHVIRSLCRDPSTALTADGRMPIRSFEQFGYVFFGPLLLVWLAWLIRQLQAQPTQHLLFLAREGYLLSRLYNTMKARLQLDELPSGIYFAASRRMAGVAALRTPDDLHAALQESYSGSANGLLRQRFGLAIDLPQGERHLTHTDPAAATLVTEHQAAILANAEAERADYLAYITRLGIAPDSEICLADLGIKGSIQHALQRMLGRPLRGYYITGWFGTANPYGMHATTAALLPQTPAGTDWQVYRHHLLCESVLVAPEGMYIRAQADGSFVHAPPRKNQALFAQKAAIHAGIAAFFEDWLHTGLAPHTAQFSPALVDAIFAQALSDNVDIAPQLKAAFYVDESYRADSEKKIWD